MGLRVMTFDKISGHLIQDSTCRYLRPTGKASRSLSGRPGMAGVLHPRPWRSGPASAPDRRVWAADLRRRTLTARPEWPGPNVAAGLRAKTKRRMILLARSRHRCAIPATADRPPGISGIRSLLSSAGRPGRSANRSRSHPPVACRDRGRRPPRRPVARGAPGTPPAGPGHAGRAGAGAGQPPWRPLTWGPVQVTERAGTIFPAGRRTPGGLSRAYLTPVTALICDVRIP